MNVISPMSPVALAMPGVAPSDLTLVSRLYLGASIPSGGWVGQDAFQGFVGDVVAQAFPNGFTIIGGQGAWRDTDTNETIREATRIIEVFHTEEDLEKVRRVAEAYKALFDQQAVGVVTTKATVSFV